MHMNSTCYATSPSTPLNLQAFCSTVTQPRAVLGLHTRSQGDEAGTDCGSCCRHGSAASACRGGLAER